MQRWVDLMARHVGQSQVSFSDAFFEWFNHQEIVFAEYPYARMDFQGDPDLVLSAGEQWSVIGKRSDHISVYCFFNVLMSFKCYQGLIKAIYLCKYWTNATSSVPEGSNYHSSRRGCREGYSLQSGRSREPCSIAGSDQGSHPWYSGCKD